MSQRFRGVWLVPHNLASFLKAISRLLNASKFLMFRENCSFFFVLHWKKWEDVRNEAIGKFVTQMEMARAISPGLFGTRMGRILDCMAELSLSDRCRSRDFRGTTAFLLCNVNFEDVKWKRKR